MEACESREKSTKAGNECIQNKADNVPWLLENTGFRAFTNSPFVCFFIKILNHVLVPKSSVKDGSE
jgi:hypothetical protein